MSDLIERVAVLEDLEKRMADDYVDAARFAEYIRALPSAEPERKKGRWIDGMPYVNSHWRVCSVCHEPAPDSSGGYNFCPNCGARMDWNR